MASTEETRPDRTAKESTERRDALPAEIGDHRHPPPPRGERAEPHAAVAGFGRFALESHDIEATTGRAVELATTVTGTSIAWLVRVVGAGRVEVLDSRGLDDVRAGDRVDVPEDFLTAYHHTQPVIVTGWPRETRFGQAPVLQRAGVRSSLSVGVLIAGATCRLTVHDLAPRPFNATDVDVVQSIGHILAAAVERDHQERAQAAVAEFGRFALRSRRPTATVARALDVVAEVLDTPLGAVSRPAGPGRLALVHGRGPIGLDPGDDYPVPPALLATIQGTQTVVIEDWRAETRFPQAAASAAACARSSLSVGFPVGDEIWRLGVLDTVPRRFRDTEVDFAQSIGHLLATAVERQQTEARLRDSNRQLQQALLPAQLPVLPGIAAAARYVPAGGDRVGGDWYDVLPLPYGGVGLVMGDVEGHDQTAAALMGQVRNVVRAYAAEGHTPAEILTGLNQLVTGHLPRLVTCCYAELDPAQRTVTCASAGHPVPLVLHPRPALEPLPVTTGLILGVDADQDYLEHTELLPQACALLMVTDGLVDGFPGAVHHGFEALAATATEAAGEPIQTFADRLAHPSPDDAGRAELRDDAALLAVQITTAALPSCDTVRRRFANRPVTPRAARAFVNDILTAWHLDQLREPAVLATSELVTNAVIHTTSPIDITLCRAGPDRIRLAVHDDSDQPVRPGRLPRVDDPQSLEPVGRGLVVIDHLADRWGVDLSTETTGKTVWLELPRELPTAESSLPAGSGRQLAGSGGVGDGT